MCPVICFSEFCLRCSWVGFAERVRLYDGIYTAMGQLLAELVPHPAGAAGMAACDGMASGPGRLGSAGCAWARRNPLERTLNTANQRAADASHCHHNVSAHLSYCSLFICLLVCWPNASHLFAWSSFQRHCSLCRAPVNAARESLARLHALLEALGGDMDDAEQVQQMAAQTDAADPQVMEDALPLN